MSASHPPLSARELKQIGRLMGAAFGILLCESCVLKLSLSDVRDGICSHCKKQIISPLVIRDTITSPKSSCSRRADRFFEEMGEFLNVQ